MGAMTKSAKKLRAKMQEAVLAEVARVGVEGVRPVAIIEPFVAKGMGKATAFRWVQQILASPMPAKTLDAEIKKATRKRRDRPSVKVPPDLISAGLAHDVVAEMPVVPRLDEAVLPGGGILAMAEKLSSCIRNAEQVAEYAKTPEGAVRNSKLLLQASEALRRALDTAIRLQSAIVEMSNVQRFNREIYQTVMALQPEAAAAMLVRLRQVNASWSYLDPGQT